MSRMSKVELFAAIRRDSRGGLSGRMIAAKPLQRLSRSACRVSVVSVRECQVGGCVEPFASAGRRRARWSGAVGAVPRG